MTTEMRRGSDARWYEPPPPRDWKTNPSALQRIESAANLRKSLLDSATKALEGGAIRRTFKVDSEKHVLERSFDKDFAARPMASLPSTPRGLQGSLRGSAQEDLESNRFVQPTFSRQMSASMRGSAMDLSSTYVFRNKLRNQDDIEQILVNTPPSRPRSSSMTKYEPLPAIKHSAGSVRVRPMDTNNNSNATASPPPLIRSRTFDVIETNLTNLPVVDDESDCTEASDVSDIQDDVPDSGDVDGGIKPATKLLFPNDRGFSVSTADSGVVSAGSYNLAYDSRSSDSSRTMSALEDDPSSPSDDIQSPYIFGSDFTDASSKMPLQVVTINIEGKTFSEYLLQMKMGVMKSRPSTQYGRDSEASSNSALSESPTSSECSQEHIINRDDEIDDDDIIVYIKMPDDTLMLASSPIGRTLKELLSIVKGTNVNGRRIAISRKGLEECDLNKSLYELGITDNTTLHLIEDGH